MSFDYRKYISFDPSPAVIAQGVDPKVAALLPDDRKKMEQALREISSTPEGQKLIRDAASHSPNGKVHIMANQGGISAAFPGEFVLGTLDRSAQFKSPETGKFHNMSIQHVVVHELHHLALGQKPGTAISHQYEVDAIKATNAYMKKYYNEPIRDPNSLTGSRTGGTPYWDLDKNFKKDGYNNKRAEMQTDKADVAQGGELNGAKSNITSRIDLGSAWRAAASPDTAPSPQPAPNVAPDVIQPIMARTQAGGMSLGGMG